MTIEKLIREIDYLIENGCIDGFSGDAIISALKAGKQLRDSLGVTQHMKRDGFTTFRTADVYDGMSAVQGCDVWDATIKEDV